MKLLIVTQTIDINDPVLGFFCRWVEEFAKHCEKVTVICLHEGIHSLPNNVRVTALGKTRVGRVFDFLHLCISRRFEYDIVFVHMNPEYIVIAGTLWRLMSKKIALWYTHKSVNLKLRIAVFFADIVFTASVESFRLPTKKLHVMGHGIDTDFFFPDTSIPRENWLLSVGRLMPSKRHDLVIRRAARKQKELRIAGEGPERHNLEMLAHELGARVQFLGPLTQRQLRDEYRRAVLLIHTSETGSLDKVVLEALACGLPVRTNDPALKPIENAGPEYIREHHSLVRLVPRILREFSADYQPDPKKFYDDEMEDKLGDDYETARWKSSPLYAAQYAMTADALKTHVLPALRAARTILEVGPGPGTWTKLLLKANPVAQYTLVDISKKMLVQARDGLVDQANVTFVESNLLAFESPQTFDFFFSSRAIEYMSDKRATVEKIASLLVPGGRGALITKMPKPFFDRVRGRASRTLHSAQITPSVLARLMRKEGLIVEKIRIATATMPLIGRAASNELVYRLLKHFPPFFPFTIFAESYLITFRKQL